MLMPNYFSCGISLKVFLPYFFCITSIFVGPYSYSMSPEETWGEMQILMEIPRSEDVYAAHFIDQFVENLLDEPDLFFENVTYVAKKIPPRDELSNLNLVRIREAELEVMVEVMRVKGKYQKISKWVSFGAGIVGTVIGMVKLKFVKRLFKNYQKSKNVDKSTKEIPAPARYLMVGVWTAIGYVVSDKGMAMIVDPAIQSFDETSLIDLLDTQIEINELRGLDSP